MCYVIATENIKKIVDVDLDMAQNKHTQNSVPLELTKINKDFPHFYLILLKLVKINNLCCMQEEEGEEVI